MITIDLPFKYDDGTYKRGPKLGKTKWVELAPSLNKMLNESRFVRKRRKEVLKELILQQINGASLPIDQANILYTRGCFKMLDEMDNLPASFKSITDEIVRAGILKDDDPKNVKSCKSVQVKTGKSDMFIQIKIWE